MLGAWSYLPSDVHENFRAELSVSDATWTRGRGWALSIALLALFHFQTANSQLANVATRVIHEVLADHKRGVDDLH